MFFRTKTASGNTYLQLVENRRGEDGRIRQRVLASLGRYDEALDKGSSTPCSPRDPDSPRR